MKIVAVIPARYKSSRFPGKPLVDICGKPMIIWTADSVKYSKLFDDVYVATDDRRIENVCKHYGIKYLMTSCQCKTHVDRIYEFSNKIKADYYVVICGDEPLITKEIIKSALPNFKKINNKKMFVEGACRYLDDEIELKDPSNIKIVTNNNDECILLTRSVVPFPYKTKNFKYKKTVGIEIYNKLALDFFHKTKKGFLETIEDVTLQRFLENGIHVKYKLIDKYSLSVDTPSDLKKVEKIIKKRKLNEN